MANKRVSIEDLEEMGEWHEHLTHYLKALGESPATQGDYVANLESAVQSAQMILDILQESDHISFDYWKALRVKAGVIDK